MKIIIEVKKPDILMLSLKKPDEESVGHKYEKKQCKRKRLH